MHGRVGGFLLVVELKIEPIAEVSE